MIDVGSILPAIFENFARLSPLRFLIIKQYERGVRFSMGRYVRVCDPGVHWYWNWWESIEVVTTVTHVVESQRLTLTTMDGRILVISAAVQYSIAEPDRYYLSIHDFDKSLLNMIEGECSRVISKSNASDILADPQRFGDKIAVYARRIAKEWGCAIENVSLPNLACVKAYRFIGEQPGFIV